MQKARVASALRGLDGTRREGLETKHFRKYEAQHALLERTRSKSLKLLAIPAGLEPATRGVEIRYSIQLSYGTVVTACWAPIAGPS